MKDSPFINPINVFLRELSSRRSGMEPSYWKSSLFALCSGKRFTSSGPWPTDCGPQLRLSVFKSNTPEEFKILRGVYLSATASERPLRNVLVLGFSRLGRH